MTTTTGADMAAATRDDALSGRLEFTRNRSRITIHAAANLTDRCEVQFEGSAPAVRRQSRNVTVE
jgi:hypothetical protein